MSDRRLVVRLLATGLVALAATAVSTVPATAGPALGTISTLAGTGVWGYGGDGGPATAAQVNNLSDVVEGADGSIYVSDWYAGRVRKIAPNGTITLFAGGGNAYGDEGAPATSVQLSDPEGLAIDHAGNVYIADTDHMRVRRVDTTGAITTVAGTGVQSFSGDGGPATSATLSRPWSLAFAPDGGLLVADSLNHRVRKIDASGKIATVVGGGSLGDGHPGLQAVLDRPSGLAFDQAGTRLLIADPGARKVRWIDGFSVIHTLAGTGAAGDTGDRGPAAAATFTDPINVGLDPHGTVYVSDDSAHRVRRIDGAGTITTLAGTGTAGWSGDGGPAAAAMIDSPRGLHVEDGGRLLIAHRSALRAVTVPGTTPNERFVTAAYRDFIGRDPTLAERTEKAGELDAGTTTRFWVARLVSASNEWVGGYVDRMYLASLGRLPDAAGRRFWISWIGSGIFAEPPGLGSSLEEGVATVFSSNEYFNRIGDGTVPTWIDHLYVAFLHRPADAAGRQFWVDQTAKRGRYSAASLFYRSLESRRERARFLFQRLLGRTPDPAGLAYWAGTLVLGADFDLGVSLATSAEYFTRAQTRGA